MSTAKIYKLYQLNTTQSKIVREVIKKVIDSINADPFYEKSISKRVIKNIVLLEISDKLSLDDKFFIKFQYDWISCVIELNNNEISKLLNAEYNKMKYINNLKVFIKDFYVVTFPTYHLTNSSYRSIYFKIAISGIIQK